MTMKTYAFAAALVVLAASCSQVLGLKDPTLDEQMGNTQKDAAIDAVPTDAPIDMAPVGCVPASCPFGCDPDSATHACRPPKLFVFATTGSFFGNGFSPDVRATADAKCFDTAAAKYANRACPKARTHAILTVDGGDSIQVMASTYSIPATVEVHRAEDDLLVFNSWNDLTDSTKSPRAPVVTAADAIANGTIAWTGFGVGGAATCTNWTSKAMNVNGVQAQVTGADTSSAPGPSWLGQMSDRCDFLQRLLCVCWTGGN
jgi:hypothetical protein